jgi:hypothetical protein
MNLLPTYSTSGRDISKKQIKHKTTPDKMERDTTLTQAYETIQTSLDG